MLRLQTGLRSSAYYLAQFTADFILFIVLNIPSLVMVLIGYRKDELSYVNEGWLFFIEFFSKLAFGFILLPLIYLMGFLQRGNAENIYKGLGVFMYVFGHFINMILLSIVIFITETQKACASYSTFYLLPMLNPFTFYFFNSTLHYFVCQDLAGTIDLT
jgi:hypothetical protein